ncbi:expressed unknown protein [Seminavis robusta]|uniref:Uncharacterized protein n=1 Tax=Seminavis robusta TaxID=568900 RepID=A0A9N8HG87_9STRA|nr:expressed unknown protein [Seminavis robusta]|eukprot:Sro619_g176430.1 n/a (657) ;mRNA; f:29891-31861
MLLNTRLFGVAATIVLHAAFTVQSFIVQPAINQNGRTRTTSSGSVSFRSEGKMVHSAFPSSSSALKATPNGNEVDAEFLGLGLGGAGMMNMLWSLAMGKKCVGVEMRGDPFLLIHWNIRADFYHQLGMIDEQMLKRYGKEGVPRRANGKLFKLAECFHSPKTCAGYVVADEVIDGHDKIHHIAGTILHYEFIDDRYRNGKPHRSVSVLKPPKIPKKPDPKAIQSTVREVLEGPSVFQTEANNVLILLRRYLEAVEEMDMERGLEVPRVRLFKRHRVKQEDGFAKDESGRVTKVEIEEVEELDYKGKLIRVPTPGGDVTIKGPELCVIAQGVNSCDAAQLGFTKRDVVVDHNDGHGPTVAQADYLAGFIDVLVDGRIRRRIASTFDKNGKEYWTRQIAVGHENDPQVGWILVQVPDYMTFCPIEAGTVDKSVKHDSPEYFAASQKLVYDFYIQETAKILEVPEEQLKGCRMAYGPKIFSLVERMGDDPRIAQNVIVAGDSFGNGHFLTSGGAMTGMVGHSMSVMKFWKSKDEEGVDLEDAFTRLSKDVKQGTQDWLDLSAKEFSSSTPVNFGIERINQVFEHSHVVDSERAESIDASRRMRHELAVQDPTDWRRPFFRNGKVLTAELTTPQEDNKPREGNSPQRRKSVKRWLKRMLA